MLKEKFQIELYITIREIFIFKVVQKLYFYTFFLPHFWESLSTTIFDKIHWNVFQRYFGAKDAISAIKTWINHQNVFFARSIGLYRMQQFTSKLTRFWWRHNRLAINSHPVQYLTIVNIMGYDIFLSVVAPISATSK